jgi:choline dehydrogenase
MGDSLVVLEKRPWVFLIELFRYLFFGTGLLLAPVVQLAIYASSFLLDARGMPIIEDKSAAERDTLPDLEILPVSLLYPKNH